MRLFSWEKDEHDMQLIENIFNEYDIVVDFATAVSDLLSIL